MPMLLVKLRERLKILFFLTKLTGERCTSDKSILFLSVASHFLFDSRECISISSLSTHVARFYCRIEFGVNMRQGGALAHPVSNELKLRRLAMDSCGKFAMQK